MTKKILVTGASGDIGSEICKTLKRNEYHVIASDICEANHSNFDEFIKCDLSNDNFLKEFNDSIISSRDELSIVFNAALQIPKRIIDHSNDEIEKVFRINLFSSILISKLFIKQLANNSIVFISSVHAKATSDSIGAYSVSKAALCGLTRTLSIELGENKTRVNTILPGAIDTKMLREGLERNKGHEDAFSKIISSSPLKKIGSPKDIASLVNFLIDPILSSNITGQEFVCDSGVLARLPSE